MSENEPTNLIPVIAWDNAGGGERTTHTSSKG